VDALHVMKLDKFSQTEEVTTREVENTLVILRKTCLANGSSPICYFEFVTNPTSFSQTIENVFYTSFLVRVRRSYFDDSHLKSSLIEYIFLKLATFAVIRDNLTCLLYICY